MILGTPIVTNGLVLALDAADQQSYVNGSTTWYDMSGNRNNGALTNGPTYSSANGGSIVFDGSNDYVQVANDTSLNSTIGTVSIWFKYNSVSTNASLIGKHDVGSSLNGYNIFLGTDGSAAVQIKNNSQTTNISGAPAYNSNTWRNITLTYSSGVSHGLYANNIQYSSGACVSFTMTTQPLRMIDSVDTFWGIMSGNISLVHIYNRILTNVELTQNYNALKSRFF